MKRTCVVLFCVILSACESREHAAPGSNTGKQATSSSGPGPAASLIGGAEKREVQPSRISPPAAEFQSEKTTAGLSPEGPAQLHFTRVVGGQARHCGALSSGPIRCWGRSPKIVPGSFMDVALGEEGYCGIELGGKLSCEKLTPPPGVYSRVVASGKNYCALEEGGAVRCFGPKGMAPQENQRARLLSVGAEFSCVADPTERLLCWGTEAPLLPLDPVRVMDVAAGAKFLCFLREDGKSQCLGKGPRLPMLRYSAINAGYETVCGITPDGAGHCKGRVEAQTTGPVRQFAVAEASVCAHRHDGKIECWGSEAERQLKVPTEAELAESAPGSKN